VIHIDTHVALYIHGHRSRLSPQAQRLIGREPCLISPMAAFEIEILFEIGRVREDSTAVVANLGRQIGLAVCDTPFTVILDHARTFAWTRDPFDRLIVASAIADGARLLTADETILANFKDAVW
jgi:PIN domain nuclease of toxin-antitoxin system